MAVQVEHEMSEATDNYSRRVDDLIAQVQKTIRDTDDFLKGRMDIEPHEYQKYKRDLMVRQSAALEAMHGAIKGQRELLKRDTPLPRRRASDRMESISEEELFDIQVRAGIE